MFIGPVFTREFVTAPRRPRLFIYRGVYAAGLLLLMCTAWLVLAGTQVIRNVSDMARFGGLLFHLLAPLQMALAVFFAAMVSASAVAQEKDRKTLILLLMTRLSNSELVLGRLLSSLLHIMVTLLAGLPVFMFAMLFGGISQRQVWSVLAVTAATVLAAGSLGSVIALWREKTFQTLALTALILVFWMGGWEAVGGGLLGSAPMGVPAEQWAAWFSPHSAVRVAASPSFDDQGWLSPGTFGFLLFAAAATVTLNGVAIARIRVWNPSREVRQQAERGPAAAEGAAETARESHVDAQLRKRAKAASRPVWDNPVLWREVRTWAHGRKVIAIRLAYWILFGLAAGALAWMTRQQPPTGQIADGLAGIVAPSTLLLVPFFLVSMVLLNALAVTTITNERDGRSLDLLLVTDLSPAEFLFGKLGGVIWNTREMVALPLVLLVGLWWWGRLDAENLSYVAGGLLVMDVFVAMLGIHCGMNYANSRMAIGASLGTVFFLFLGVVTCILMMISFSGAFHAQLAPFLAFILGGGVGLYVALGYRNPSPAIGAASLLLPFATFYGIVSFLLGFNLPVFLVTAVTYGFTTAAMMIPALFEFDFAMGRERTAEE